MLYPLTPFPGDATDFNELMFVLLACIKVGMLYNKLQTGFSVGLRSFGKLLTGLLREFAFGCSQGNLFNHHYMI